MKTRKTSKKATAILLATALVASATPLPSQAAESYARNITIQVDGRTIPQTDQKAFIKDSRTMVPLRTVMEGLHMDVKWNGTDRSITVRDKTNQNNSYLFYVDKSYFLARIGTQTRYVELDVAPYITSNNRTVMPLRAIGETYGKVEWDDASSIVKITANKTVEPKPTVKPEEPKVTPQVMPEQAKPQESKVQEKDQPIKPQEPEVKEPETNKPTDYDNPPAGYRYIKMTDSNGNLTYKLVEIHEKNVLLFSTEVEIKAHVEAMESSEYQSYVTPYAIKVLEETNRYRAMNGVAPLKLSPILCKAADIRAKECLIYPNVKTMKAFEDWKDKGNNPHTRPDEKKPSTVLNDLGHPWSFVGENLYSYYPSSDKSDIEHAIKTTTGWYNSPGHRAAMLDSSFKYMGAMRAKNEYCEKDIQFFS